MRVDFHRIYAPEDVRELQLDGVPACLKELPCCVRGGPLPAEERKRIALGDAAGRLAASGSSRRASTIKTVRIVDQPVASMPGQAGPRSVRTRADTAVATNPCCA